MAKKSKQSLAVCIITTFMCFATIQSAVAQTRSTTTKPRSSNSTTMKSRYRSIGKVYSEEGIFCFYGKPVDLGLSVMWADRNIGAYNQSDYGGLFAWGDVLGYRKKSQKLSDYPNEKCISGNRDYDVATALEEGWRMPTIQEVIELYEKCRLDLQVTGRSDYAVKFIAPNGNSILLPCGGNLWNGIWQDFGTEGYYWTGDLNQERKTWNDGKIGQSEKNTWTEENSQAAAFLFNCTATINGIGKKMLRVGNLDKRFGFCIRPVKDYPGSSAKQKSTTSPNNNGKTGKQQAISAKNSTGATKPGSGTRTEETIMVIENEFSQIVDTIPQRKKGYYDERAVDLGLSVLWADRFVGANNNLSVGRYYSWGDPKDTNKRRNLNYLTDTDVKNVSSTKLDVATQKWGAGWRMPTDAECKELKTECKWEFTSIDGVSGCKVIGKNGNWIFMPITGFKSSTSSGEISAGENYSMFWTATAKNKKESYAMVTGNDITPIVYYYDKYYKMCIRPVMNK